MMTDHVTEYLWNIIHPTLPLRKKHIPQKVDVQFVGDVDVPDKLSRVLELAPKFCFEPKLSTLETLAPNAFRKGSKLRA